MQKARQQFLNTGYYQPLHQALIQFASQYITNPQHILDIGCGEGYYTDKLRQLAPHVWGLDIAKRGIRLAAKHYPQCQFLIASNKRLPFASQSLDLITRIFAPQQDSEIVRCLKAGSYLIAVIPGESHLKQFRKLIYPEFRPHQDEAKPISGMNFIMSKRLNYEIEPSQNEREELMAMTPFNWKLNEKIRQQFKEDKQPIEVAFTLHLYQKFNFRK